VLDIPYPVPQTQTLAPVDLSRYPAKHHFILGNFMPRMGNAYDNLPTLSIDEARELLSKHSFTHDDLNDPRMENGFIGSLRPYRGTLNHEAFREVVACLKSLAPTLSGSNDVDRRTVSNIWGICYLARDWGTHPDGMLRRNNLITSADSQTLEKWVDCLSYAVMMLLEDPDPNEAFVLYEDLVGEPDAG